MCYKFPSNARVLMLGDSYTQNGMWHQEAQHLLKKLDGAQKIKLFNCGIGGDTMHGAHERLKSDAARYEPTHLFVLFGANDSGYGGYTRSDRERFEKTVAARPQTFARYEEALRGILADARALGWVPLIGTPIRLPLSETHAVDTAAVNEVIDGFAAICRRVAAEENVPCLDLNARMGRLYDSWQGDAEHELFIEDHVHPTRMGYRLIGRAWMAELGYEVDLPTNAQTFEATAQAFDFYDEERSKVASSVRSCAFIQHCLSRRVDLAHMTEEAIMTYVLDWLAQPELGNMWRQHIREWIIWHHRTGELRTREELIAEALVNDAAKNDML